MIGAIWFFALSLSTIIAGTFIAEPMDVHLAVAFLFIGLGFARIFDHFERI